MEFTLNFPGELRFGNGTIQELGDYAKAMGNHCLVVAGKSTVASGALAKATDSLEKAGVTYIIYDEVGKEPDTLMVDRVREVAEAAQVNLVVGLGGGSVLDVAKAAAGLMHQPLSTGEYLRKAPFEYRGVPFIGIPTTAGTGSEITLNSVLHDPQQGNKLSIAHPKFQARVSIIDPELTYSMSPRLTAITGLDALTHGIESYTSIAANPVTKALAGKAIALIAQNLERAVAQGDDPVARENMAMGSMVAALAFAQTGVGIAHAISHPLGALFEIPHGLANGILLPKVMAYNEPACQEAYGEIAHYLGGEGSAQEQVQTLVAKMPIPQTLLEAGYRPGQEEAMIQGTMASRSLKKNPRAAEAQDILDILNRCM